MSQTSDRYAKALFDSIKDNSDLEALQDSLTAIRDIIITSKEFRLFLSNPLLSYDERCVVLKALFEGKVPELGLKFLLFITYKKRLNLLKDIIESFDRLYLGQTHQLRAYITTALQVHENEKTLFDGRLHDKFQRHMLTKWRIDPSLIGGFRIFVRDTMYDYSFKNQLNNFFQQTTQSA